MENEKLNILRLLIESEEQGLSIRQISLKRKVNYKSAYLSIRKLCQEGIVKVEKQGHATICRFSQSFNSSVFTVEYTRLQELLRNSNFKVLYNRFKAVNSQYVLLLFGSYAKKKQTKHSDIDLLLITNQPEEIQKQAQLLPLPIHLTSITYTDFRAMLKSKEFTVVSEAIKRNILLFGVEDYYRLLNNAR